MLRDLIIFLTWKQEGYPYTIVWTNALWKGHQWSPLLIISRCHNLIPGLKGTVEMDKEWKVVIKIYYEDEMTEQGRYLAKWDNWSYAWQNFTAWGDTCGPTSQKAQVH